MLEEAGVEGSGASGEVGSSNDRKGFVFVIRDLYVEQAYSSL